uniref:hydroxyacylglutathione hydrolase n=1 Tax=Ningiella ruwaisensis TaxID=2364274 RepID=UPI00109FF1B4|nr:hydroxyacylglutathione hydrolase [Ningiella ruwaisensis]
MSSALHITAIKAFTDNYIWCIHNDTHAAVVDPGNAAPVLQFLKNNSLVLSDILITHHHYDHTGGVLDLKDACQSVHVLGPVNDKILGVNTRLVEGDKISILNDLVSFEVLETPGHTLDHIAFFNGQWLFCGDTLFSAGCGRMFEGTPDVFLASLDKLSALPGHLKVYCTHEYTLANLKFARFLLPHDKALAEYETWAKAERAENRITLPSTIEQQREINPFLQCHKRSFQASVAEKLQSQRIQITLQNENAISTFAAIRAAKDNFA